MEQHKLYQLLDDFAYDTISNADRAELIEYLRKSRSDEALFAAMEQIWLRLKPEYPFSTLQSDLLYDSIISHPRFQASTNESRKVVRLGSLWQKAAAILVLGITALIGVQLYRNNQTDQTKGTSVAQQLYTSITADKNRKHITLPDGSTVWLNQGSTISFITGFNAKVREIKLKGEAYFDVYHINDRPFIVTTGKVTTQVLGTAFDVKAYEVSNVVVTVTRGKVSVLNDGQKISELTPDKRLFYNSKTKQSIKSKVTAASLVAWKDGSLVLNNVTISEAAATISKWYNTPVTFSGESDQNNEKRFSICFLNNENINQVMNVVCSLNNYKYTRDDSQITISQ